MSLIVNGTDQYAYADSTSSLTSHNQTCAFWVKANSFSWGGDTPVSFANTAGSNAYRVSTTGANAFNFSDLAGGSSTGVGGPTGLSSGVWMHVAFVRVGTEPGTEDRLYIDGTLYTGSGNYGDAIGINRVCFGAFGQNAFSAFFNGSIAFATVWNRILTGVEISSLATPGVDPTTIQNADIINYWSFETDGSDSVGGVNLSLVGSPTFGAQPFDFGFDFDIHVDDEGTKATVLVANLSGSYQIDDDLLAQSYFLITSPTPLGGTTTRKIGVSITPTANSLNTLLTLKFERHPESLRTAPMIFSADTDCRFYMPANTITGSVGGNSLYDRVVADISNVTLTYRKNPSRWVTIESQQVSSSLILEVAAFSANGVGSVRFYHSGTSSGGSSTLLGTATTMTAASTPDWLIDLGLPRECYYYRHAVDLSALPDGPNFFDFKVNPIIGDADSCTDTRPTGLGDTVGCGQLRIFNNYEGSLSAETLWFSPTGVDGAPADGSEVAPFRTASYAFTQLSNPNGATLIAAEGTYHTNEMIVTQRASFTNTNMLVITGDPSKSRDLIEWRPDTTYFVGNNSGLESHWCLRHMKIILPRASACLSTASVLHNDDTNAHTWIDDLSLDGINRLIGIDASADVVAYLAYFPTTSRSYATNIYATNSSFGIGYAWIARNIVCTNSTFFSAQNALGIFNIYGSEIRNSGTSSDPHNDFYQTTNSIVEKENVILYNVHLNNRDPSRGGTFRMQADAPQVNRIAIVNWVVKNDLQYVVTMQDMEINVGNNAIIWNMTNDSESLIWSSVDFGNSLMSVRNCVVSSYVKRGGSGNYFSAFASDMNIQNTGVSGDLSSQVSHVTTESNASILWTDSSDGDLSPSASSPLLNRIPAGSPLVIADYFGLLYRGDGTDAIGGANVAASTEDNAPADPWPKRTAMINHMNSSIHNPSGCWKDYNRVHKEWLRTQEISRRMPGLFPQQYIEPSDQINPALYPNLDSDCTETPPAVPTVITGAISVQPGTGFIGSWNSQQVGNNGDSGGNTSVTMQPTFPNGPDAIAQIDGYFYFGIIARHKNGIERVECSIENGPRAIQTGFCINPSRSGRRSQYEYGFKVALSDFDSSSVKEIRFEAFPLGSGKTTIVIATRYFDPAGVYSRSIRYLDPANISGSASDAIVSGSGQSAMNPWRTLMGLTNNEADADAGWDLKLISAGLGLTPPNSGFTNNKTRTVRISPASGKTATEVEMLWDDTNYRIRMLEIQDCKIKNIGSRGPTVDSNVISDVFDSGKTIYVKNTEVHSLGVTPPAGDGGTSWIGGGSNYDGQQPFIENCNIHNLWTKGNVGPGYYLDCDADTIIRVAYATPILCYGCTASNIVAYGSSHCDGIQIDGSNLTGMIWNFVATEIDGQGIAITSSPGPTVNFSILNAAVRITDNASTGGASSLIGTVGQGNLEHVLTENCSFTNHGLFYEFNTFPGPPDPVFTNGAIRNTVVGKYMGAPTGGAVEVSGCLAITGLDSDAAVPQSPSWASGCDVSPSTSESQLFTDAPAGNFIPLTSGLLIAGCDRSVPFDAAGNLRNSKTAIGAFAAAREDGNL